MSFNSFTFLVFLPIVLISYHFVPTRFRNLILLCASYTFYGWWEYRYLVLLFSTTAVDFFCAQKIQQNNDCEKKRKAYLLVSLASNFTCLGFFKYFNFFSQSFADLFQLFGMKLNFPILDIILPIGISFYTLQTVSYVIDVYRRKLKAGDNFLNFALYVSFFPQLVAGPIERATNLLPQLENIKRKVVKDKIWEGIILINIGLLKKVILADSIAPIADKVFANWKNLDSVFLWQGVFIFGLQIYFDFSSYSDIARGVAKFFGVELVVNFRQPYLAVRIGEMWTRWHISLSTWVRDYIYFPLGGSRKGTVRKYLNIFIILSVMGLWHGPSLCYLFFGLHYLVVYFIELVVIMAISKTGLKPIINRIWFFLFPIHLVLFYLVRLPSHLFFRNLGIRDSFLYLFKMVSFKGDFDPYPIVYSLFYFLVMLILDLPAYKFNSDLYLIKFPKSVQIAFVIIVSITVLLLLSDSTRQKPYIYFQF